MRLKPIGLNRDQKSALAASTRRHEVAGTVEAGVSAALYAELFNENSKRGRGVRLARNLARLARQIA